MRHEPEYKLSVVIPVYGSEQILPELVGQLHAVLDRIPDLRDKYEIIFVCDLSPDRSWDVIKSFAAKHSTVRGILLRRNAGH